jgi:carbonic anhydrase
MFNERKAGDSMEAIRFTQGKQDEERAEKEEWQISRRSLLGGLGMAGISAAALGTATLSPTAWGRMASAMPDDSDNDAAPVSASEAMERLKVGNKRFASGSLPAKRGLGELRGKLTAGQHPFVTFLSCSDSRVPPELVFDQSLGDIFLIRMAGNIVDTDVLGSIEYSLVHLKVPLLYVLGHQKCGAVDAALAEMLGHGGKEPPNIDALIRKIIPGLKGVDLQLPPDKRLEAGVEANVQWTVKQLQEAPVIKRALEGKVGLAAGVYQMGSGEIKMMGEWIPK